MKTWKNLPNVFISKNQTRTTNEKTQTKNGKKNLDPKGRTPPFRRLSCKQTLDKSCRVRNRQKHTHLMIAENSIWHLIFAARTTKHNAFVKNEERGMKPVRAVGWVKNKTKGSPSRKKKREGTKLAITLNSRDTVLNAKLRHRSRWLHGRTCFHRSRSKFHKASKCRSTEIHQLGERKKSKSSNNCWTTFQMHGWGWWHVGSDFVHSCLCSKFTTDHRIEGRHTILVRQLHVTHVLERRWQPKPMPRVSHKTSARSIKRISIGWVARAQFSHGEHVRLVSEVPRTRAGLRFDSRIMSFLSCVSRHSAKCACQCPSGQDLPTTWQTARNWGWLWWMFDSRMMLVFSFASLHSAKPAMCLSLCFPFSVSHQVSTFIRRVSEKCNHYTWHIGWFCQYFNLKQVWTYQDEDFMEKVAQIAASARGIGPCRFGLAFIFHHKNRLHTRYNRRCAFFANVTWHFCAASEIKHSHAHTSTRHTRMHIQADSIALTLRRNKGHTHAHTQAYGKNYRMDLVRQ